MFLKGNTVIVQKNYNLTTTLYFYCPGDFLSMLPTELSTGNVDNQLM